MLISCCCCVAGGGSGCFCLELASADDTEEREVEEEEDGEREAFMEEGLGVPRFRAAEKYTTHVTIGQASKRPSVCHRE